MKTKLTSAFQWLRKHFRLRWLWITGFVVFMAFFDENSFMQSYHLENRIKELERDVNHYKSVSKESRERLDELHTDHENLEKFAREQFLIKQPDEDLFIIIPQK